MSGFSTFRFFCLEDRLVGVGTLLATFLVVPTVLFYVHFVVVKGPDGEANCSVEMAGMKAIHLPNVNTKIVLNSWKSQAGQDRLVLSALVHPPFKRNGYYVDIAANDPVELSNTVIMDHLLKWQGICWEANPNYWYSLASKRSCTIVGGAAFSFSGGSVPFNFQGVNGRVVGDSAKKSLKAKTQDIPTSTLTEVLEKAKFPRDLDYLSLDVEGAESAVLAGFDFTRYIFQVLTIERPNSHLVDTLQAHGYLLLGNQGWFGETVWIHKSNPNYETVKNVTNLNTFLQQFNWPFPIAN